jgi:hypothetical protein
VVSIVTLGSFFLRAGIPPELCLQPRTRSGIGTGLQGMFAKLSYQVAGQPLLPHLGMTAFPSHGVLPAVKSFIVQS